MNASQNHNGMWSSWLMSDTFAIISNLVFYTTEIHHMRSGKRQEFQRLAMFGGFFQWNNKNQVSNKAATEIQWQEEGTNKRTT